MRHGVNVPERMVPLYKQRQLWPIIVLSHLHCATPQQKPLTQMIACADHTLDANHVANMVAAKTACPRIHALISVNPGKGSCILNRLGTLMMARILSSFCMRREARIVKPSDDDSARTVDRCVDTGVGSARMPDDETRKGKNTLVDRFTTAFMNRAFEPALVASAVKSGSFESLPPAIASRV